MKKRIALLLAAAMLLSMTACGGAAKSEAISTETATEPVETEPANPYTAQSEIDAALRNAEAPVLSWEDNDTYNVALKGMGYKEVDFTKSVIGDQRSFYDKEGNISSSPIPAATVHNIQFVGDMVRVEMSWYEHEDRNEEDGWVLYCTKTDGIADISGIDVQNYDGYEPFNFADAFEEWGTGFVERWDYQYIHPNRTAIVQAYYYPESGNLYNLVKTFDYFPETVCAPHVLCTDEVIAEDYFLDSEMELTFVEDYPISVSEFQILCDDQVKTYRYRLGMSLAAWASSELNTDGWILCQDNMLCSPDHRYGVECVDWNMWESGYKSSEVGIVSVLTRSAWAKPSDTETVAAYLLDWQTPLLSTGFAVVGDRATEEELAYGMYDMGYGCELGGTLRIYMRNVHPALLGDVKVYAFRDNGDRVIPENALCFGFENVEDLSAKDARFGITMALATYDTAADPNFTPDEDLAFAITYRGKLVYWIHLPA